MQNWKRHAWRLFCLVQVVVFLIAAEKPANAYVDPGTGLLFLQVAGSMLAGALFVMRQKIRKLLRLGKPEDEGALQENPTADETGAGPAA